MKSCAISHFNEPTCASLRILIVDDDKDILGSIRDILELEDNNFIIETASSYKKALSIAKTFKPDIALLDIRIGADNGIDLVKPLRAMFSDIICIMMTAYRDSEYTISAIRAGANDYIFKPLDPIKLFRTIRQFQLSQNLLRERLLADQRFRAIFNQSFQFLFILDQAGDIVDINNTATETTGVKKESVIGSQFADAPWWHDSNTNKLAIKKAVCNAIKGESNRIEAQLQDKDGNRLIFDFSLKSILNAEGNTIMIIPEGMDITERKANEHNILYLNSTLEQRVKKRTEELEIARDEAVRANSAKDTFLSHMSHELRTPMNSILGFTQLLTMDEAEPLSEHQLENVSFIHNAGEHLLSLINQMLDLTQMSSGKFHIDLKDVALASLFEESLQLLQPAIEEKSIQLVNRLVDNQLPLVSADPRAIKQVIINLLSNAVKFSTDNSHIIISSECRESSLRVHISDEGPGIAREHIERIFQPFERIQNSSTVEGNGIGLAVCKNIMDLMNGSIGVDSTPGEGSTFWFEIALGQAEAN